MSHLPVMLDEIVAALAPAPGVHVIDATFGGGGYTLALLARGARVSGIDRDPQAGARASALMDAHQGRFSFVAGRFALLDQLVNGPVEGVVFDIGVSSYQLDEGARGFSFRMDAPLDMRMGAEGVSAADLVEALPEGELADVLFHLGDERASRRIARAIVQARTQSGSWTTLRLAELVEQALGGRKGDPIHPATRTFQALRIAVNDELGELIEGLHAAERVLGPGGRLVVVSFHSLEDRLVKAFLDEAAGREAGGSRYVPAQVQALEPVFEIASRRGQSPSQAEVARNPRARSAKMRVAVRTSAPARPMDGLATPWPRPVIAGQWREAFRQGGRP